MINGWFRSHNNNREARVAFKLIYLFLSSSDLMKVISFSWLFLSMIRLRSSRLCSICSGVQGRGRYAGSQSEVYRLNHCY